jgi:ComF family protein
MFQVVLEVASSLVFPLECEICKAVLPPLPAVGVCAKCESEIRLIAPPHCLTCGRTLKGNSARCAECLERVFHFDRAYACTPYEGHMKELLHVYKFGGRKYLANFFIRLMTRFFEEHLDRAEYDAVLPVPVDAERSRERGFNQSALVSAALAKRLGLPHEPALLKRSKSASPQSLLPKEERKSNVVGRFSAGDTTTVRGKRVLLIDDILTTGCTASESARVLKEAGARSVTVLACARGI